MWSCSPSDHLDYTAQDITWDLRMGQYEDYLIGFYSIHSTCWHVKSLLHNFNSRTDDEHQRFQLHFHNGRHSSLPTCLGANGDMISHSLPIFRNICHSPTNKPSVTDIYRTLEGPERTSLFLGNNGETYPTVSPLHLRPAQTSTGSDKQRPLPPANDA